MFGARPLAWGKIIVWHHARRPFGHDSEAPCSTSTAAFYLLPTNHLTSCMVLMRLCSWITNSPSIHMQSLQCVRACHSNDSAPCAFMPFESGLRQITEASLNFKAFILCP